MSNLENDSISNSDFESKYRRSRKNYKQNKITNIDLGSGLNFNCTLIQKK